MTRPAAALAAALLLAGCRVEPSAPASDSGASPADSAVNVAVPSVAVTPEGATFTTSVVGQGEARRLVVTRPDGSTVEIARGGVSDHSQAAPRLAVAPDGALLVLYAVEVPVPGRRFPASDLFLARSTDAGRTFGAPARVNPTAEPPTGHTFADLAVAPDGAVVVSWLDGTAQDAWTARNPEPAGADPHHGAHGHGAGPGTTLAVARSADGGRTFEAPVAVARGVCPCCRTALDAAPDGAVRVTWRHVWPDGARDPAIATSRTGGRSFSAPVRVHEDGWAIDACPHAGPAVATDRRGRVHVMWYTGAAGRQGLWHAVSEDGAQTFDEPTPLDAGAPLGQARLARDRAGRVWMAWEDRRGSDVRLAPAAGGDTLQVAGIDPALAGSASGPVLAVIEGGAVRLHTPPGRGR